MFDDSLRDWRPCLMLPSGQVDLSLVLTSFSSRCVWRSWARWKLISWLNDEKNGIAGTLAWLPRA